MSRKQIIVLLLVALCSAVGYAWIATPKQRRITPGKSIPRQTEKSGPGATTAAFPEIVDLDFSDGKNNHYQEPQKNLFAPLYLPPKAVKSLSVPRPVKRMIKPTKKPQKIVQQQAPGSIQPLDVLGYLKKNGEYTIFLSSKQGEIYLVKRGDVFADNLIIRSVDNKKVIVSQQGTDHQVTLSLGEAKSQRLPKLTLQAGSHKVKLPKEPKVEKNKNKRKRKQTEKPPAAPATDNVIRTTDDVFKPYMGDR